MLFHDKISVWENAYKIIQKRLNLEYDKIINKMILLKDFFSSQATYV